MKKKHIIAACASPLILAEIKAELTESFDVSICHSSDSAAASLEKYGAAAVILFIEDAEGKDFSAYAPVLSGARAAGVPVLFLAERDNEQDENTAFEIGGADYSVMRRTSSGALAARVNLRICESRSECENSSVTKTLLIAEDVELNREVIRSILSEDENLLLEFAEDGREAVDKFEKEPRRFSLILMDVNMPVMDGLEASRAIRLLNCENARDIPIIAMTAFIQREEIDACLKAGMDGYIKKPMTYEELTEIIAEYC